MARRVGAAWDVTGSGRARGPLVVWHQLRAADRDLPAGARIGRAVWQPAHADGKHPVRRSMHRNVPGGQLLPVQVPPPRDVVFPGLGSYAADRSEHQLDPRAVVERHRRAAARRVVAGRRELPGHLPGSHLGTGRARIPASIWAWVRARSVASPIAVCSTAANTDARRVFSQVERRGRPEAVVRLAVRARSARRTIAA